jgi:hypothetical protein
MLVTEADAKSHCKRTPAWVPESQESKEKKKKRLEARLERRQHFTPFVCSVDGFLGREAQTFAKRLVAKLANKWEKSRSQAGARINARLSIATVCAAHLRVRGSWVPAHKIRTELVRCCLSVRSDHGNDQHQTSHAANFEKLIKRTSPAADLQKALLNAPAQHQSKWICKSRITAHSLFKIQSKKLENAKTSPRHRSELHCPCKVDPSKW